MKKSVFGLAALMLLGTMSAYAAETTYVTDEKYVSYGDAGKYKTAVVMNASNDIVYINQEDGGFSPEYKFFLSSEPEEGVYTIKLGGGSEANFEKEFYIGIGQIYGDAQASRIEGDDGISQNDDGTYNIGYLVTVPEGVYRSILVKDGDRTLGYSIYTVTSGGGEIIMGIQINGVPEEKKDNLQVSLSTRAIENGNISESGGENDE